MGIISMGYIETEIGVIYIGAYEILEAGIY